MTLPTLIQKQNDAAIIASLKKNYSILSQALTKSQIQYGFFETWDFAASGMGATDEGKAPTKMKEIYERIKPELKVIKECEDVAGCWHKGRTKALNSTNTDSRDSIGIGNGIFVFRLADGTNICIDDYNQNQMLPNFGYISQSSGYVFWIDTNGDKNPNTIGRDIFAFVLTKKGLVPAGIDSDDCTTNKTIHSGATCTAKVLAEGKIDY